MDNSTLISLAALLGGMYVFIRSFVEYLKLVDLQREAHIKEQLERK